MIRALLLAAALGVTDPSVERFLDRALPERATGSAAVVRDGRLVHCRGFTRATGCDTVYDIGSITKQFTATAILKLEQMGRLRVSDPIARWIGPVPPDKAAITLQQLLTHTSGLPDALGDDYDVLTREQMRHGLRRRLHHQAVHRHGDPRAGAGWPAPRRRSGFPLRRAGAARQGGHHAPPAPDPGSSWRRERSSRT